MKQIPIESFNLQMLNVGLAHHNGDWNWKEVSSPFTRIFYVTEGEAQLHLPEETVRLRPGYMYIIPPYTKHSYQCEGPFTHYYLHVYEGFKNEMNMMELYEFPAEVKAGRDENQIFKGLCEGYPDACLPESNPNSYDNAATFTDYVQRYRDMPLWKKMELRGALLVLFSRFMREVVPHSWTTDERIKNVLGYIHAHIGENIDVEKLSGVACITKPYLIRLFKKEFGLSPLQYINTKKVERAQLMLYTTDQPVKEVAYSLGFTDHSYFIRVFRKQTGVTPQEYRDRMRK